MSTGIPGTDEQIVVHESGYRQGKRVVTPESDGQRFKVRLMGWEPGATVVEGSSADYPVERIIRDFPAAFPEGTRMRANHDSMCEAGGDIRRVWGKTTSAPWREEDGMYSWAVAREGEASDFIRQFGDVIGTSIRAAVITEQTPKLDADGKPVLDEDGEPITVPLLSERGAKIAERFLPMSEAPYNSIDFVEAPGADGAIVHLALESARNIVDATALREATGFAIDLAGKREKAPIGLSEGYRPGSTPVPGITSTEERMDPKDIAAIAEALASTVAESLKPVIDLVAEHNAASTAAAGVKPGDAPSTKELVRKAVESLQAIEDANIASETLKASLVTAVEEGRDITDELEFARKVTAESAAGEGGAPKEFVLGEGSGAKTAHSFAVTGLIA